MQTFKMEAFRLSFLVYTISLFTFVRTMGVLPYNNSLTSNATANLDLSPSHQYMNLLCNMKKVLHSRDAILMSASTNKYPPTTFSCVVGVEEYSYSNYRFVITFKDMDLYPRSFGTCQYSRLDLFTGQSVASANRISGSSGLCGTSTKHISYETTSNFLTLKFITASLPSNVPQEFEAVITPFHYGTCKHDEFKCSNSKCVKNNMRCDSYNNCGDDSDEANCAGILTIAAIIGIVVGSVVFIAIIATICICFCCCGCCGMCGYERF